MKTLVVAGYGMVAHRLVRTLRELDHGGTWRVVVLAEERRPAYDRVSLSSYVDDWDIRSLTLPDVSDDDLVSVRLGDPVVTIDRTARTVTTAAGHTQPYDALVLATGSVPFVPPVPGHHLPGCFVYRTVDDLDALPVRATNGHTRRPSAMGVGGGLLALETANALRGMGLSPPLGERGRRL